ncbi:MAG: DNRLRE domain-containing protein, partial [Eubacterium sp.]|nr:DNRLRE domain-containing protein [Eubacterium sp.]
MSSYERSENKHNCLKKIVSVFLVLALCITSFPVASIAKENEEMADIEEDVEPYVLQELEEYRTIDTKQFLMSDHTVQAVMYNEPVHYEENGEWEDIDNSLEFEESADKDDFDGYKTKEGNFNVKFAEKSDSDKLVTITENDYELSWTLLNKSKARLFADDIDIEETVLNDDSTVIEESVENVSQTVTYNNIINDTDIEYTVNGKGLKENIIVNEPTDDYTYPFEITANNLILTLQEDSSIIAADSETEESIYIIPTMFMYDANNEVSQDISVSLEQVEENKYILTINANCDWINDESREFPITIDPQVKSKQVDDAIQVSCVSSLRIIEDIANNDNCVFGGYDLKYGITRLLLKFDLPELNPNDIIINSKLNIYEVGIDRIKDDSKETQINAHMIKSNWSGAAWILQPIYDTTVLDYDFIKKSDKDSLDKGVAVLKSWDITNAVKAWYENDKK